MKPNAYHRLRAFPFQASIAGLAVLTGATGLLHIGTSTSALQALMPNYLVDILNALYLTSGLAMLSGQALPRRDIEGFGLVVLASSVLVRGAALVLLAGVTEEVITIYVFYLMILWACAVRLRQLILARDVAVAYGRE